MTEIKPDQTTITGSEKTRALQQCRFIIDTYSDKLIENKKERLELEKSISDAQDKMKHICSLEVV
jgi:hypothetical protein